MSGSRRMLLSLTLVPALCLGTVTAAGADDAPAARGLAETIFTDDFAAGLPGWQAVHGGDIAEWEYVEDSDVSYVTVDALSGSSGRYIVPDSPLDLPAEYELRTRVRFDEAGPSAKLSVLTDVEHATTDITSKNLAVQIPGPGSITVAKPVSKITICSGSAPVVVGEWHDLVIRRAADISVVEIDGQQVAAVRSPEVGGTIALSGYHARVSFASVAVDALDGVPADHPAEPAGCEWQEPGGPDVDQPVLVNQSGYNLGLPKRFTAPYALDGEPFTVTDGSGAVRDEGTVEGGVGDFSAFEPADTGPFTVHVDGQAGAGRSVPFGIGAYWIERVSYENAIGFMTGSRCYFGDLRKKADGPGLKSDVNGHPECIKAVTWRDGAHYSMEVPALIDLYLSNPAALARIEVPDAVYEGMPVRLPADTPEVVRLIHWGVELLLDAEVNDPQLKEQLAAFLYAYPYMDEYIPRNVYERARDHLFAVWGDPRRDRYYWQAYTPHTGDLFQVYTQVGTGKGELAPGHSVWPNAMMSEVARREGRDDADRYLQAARDQAAWLIANLDLTDPATTKGQRQSEYVLITGLVRFAERFPSAAPDGIEAFVREWAGVVVERSDNYWDFRRYSDQRWTIPSFVGGGSGEDPNETGNVAGFAAPALAAARLLGGDPLADRLREIAVAHVDNIFGRNPTGRHASYRAPTEQWGFEGVERGWFSEYQGGYGRLQGLVGVLDGSPKNGHYPFNPGTPNIGHTEGWVAFNSAWNESLAWRSVDATTVAVRDADDAPVAELAPDETATIELTAPLNLDAAALDEGAVQVRVGDADAVAVPVVQTGGNARTFAGRLEPAALGAQAGDVLTVSYGLGYFSTSVPVAVDACPAGHSAGDTIAFGASGSGVPNDDRGDGCTFLDVIDAQAPFAGHGRFVAAVARTAEQWLTDGLFTRQEKDAVVAAASRSGQP